MMRTMLVAATTLAILATPVYAQFHDVTDKHQGGRIGPPPSGLKDGDRVNERDYKAAINRIPADTQKPDPWRTVRDKSPAK